jgi:hypothetical protein
MRRKHPAEACGSYALVACRSAGPFHCEAAYGLSESLENNVGGIEVVTDPFQAFGMLLVIRIGDRIEKLAVSPRGAEIPALQA